MCANVYVPGLALIFFFQIKACKERWDTRCTRGALKWRCAAAQDQIKMKITVWSHFMRWVQWPSKTMPFYWYPSWAAGAATAVYSGTLCGWSEPTSGLYWKPYETKQYMYIYICTLQTQQPYTALLSNGKKRLKEKKKKCNFKRRDVSACSRTVSAHLSTDGNCQTRTVC